MKKKSILTLILICTVMILSACSGMKKEDALIALGEAVWERLYELYNVKPRFERR